MELAEKRNLIRDNKEIVVESINTTLDSLYNLLAPVQNEDGSVDEKMFKNDEAKNFAVNLLKDTEQYEHVRTKIIKEDFDNLTLREIAYANNCLLFVSMRAKSTIDSMIKAKIAVDELIEKITKLET